MREECRAPLDVELWGRAASGDSDAFGLLFDRHATAVYNFCFRRIGSWSAAEDLTSVVFMQAWRRRKEIKPQGDDLLPWLLAVANKVVGNARRSRRRHRALMAKLSEEDPRTTTPRMWPHAWMTSARCAGYSRNSRGSRQRKGR
jgi:RNA polymerase sigma-70 factor (ECF subfamily)